MRLMILWQQASIKIKLTIIFFLVNTLAMIVVFLILLNYQYHSFKSSLLENITVQAQMIQSNISAALVFNDQKNADEILSALRYSPYVKRAEVLLNNGEQFAYYNNLSFKTDNGTELAKQQSSLYSMVLRDEIVVNQQVVGTLILEVSLHSLYISLLWFFGITMGAGFIALLAAFSLSNRLNLTIVAPLSRLTTLMHNLANSENYKVRTNINSSDEIGQLAKGFDQLLSHIEEHEVLLQSELEQRTMAEHKFEQLAHYDVVTTLPNRHFFNHHLQQAIVKARDHQQILAVMFIDLDNFKIVNDTLGHQAGDVLLKGAAERIGEAVHFAGIACRIGGDEFAIIMENIASIEQTNPVAEKIIRLLNQPFNIYENNIYVGASIGISLFPLHAKEMSVLLSHADAAMYHAKSLGKNNYQHFQLEMEGKVQRRLNMENSLRHAIETEQLEVYYQPQLGIHSLNIEGFEALVRWNHPQMGVINPGEFISIAEESGLILLLGEWVMLKACCQVKQWQDQYHKLFRIAVNFSGKQLKDDHMLSKINHVLSVSKLPAQTLDIELTESSLMDHSDTSINKMQSLRQAGIHIAIDDFGTGFSSLSYLKRFPITALKIDRSFINDLPDDEDNIAIANAIIALAQTLKIEVIAEGVETKGQLEFLRNNSSCQAQGYLFSKPLPASNMEKFLNDLQPPLQFKL